MSSERLCRRESIVQKAAVGTGLSCDIRSQVAAAWRHCRSSADSRSAEQFRCACQRNLVRQKRAGNERPVRGDNRTGQAIWALGVDGRSRRIQPMGRDNRSHTYSSRQRRRTFKPEANFFNFLGCRSWQIAAENHRAAGRSASFAADLSDAMAAPAVVQGAAHGSVLPGPRLFPPPACPVRAATGTAGAATAAVTAAKASASPAPNRSSRPGRAEIARGLHQDRAHFVRLQRRIALQHQRGEPADVGGGKRGA